MPQPTHEQIRARCRAVSAEDFTGTVRSVFPYWDLGHRPFLLHTIAAFPAADLDFKPRPESLTAREMLVHIAEAEYAWIAHIIDGAPYEEWVVPADDPAQGWKLAVEAPDHAALVALLERWHQPTQAWLDRPVAELSRLITYRSQVDGVERQYTLQWILDNAQQHEIHHRAQLNLYLRMLGHTPPPF